MRLDIFLLLSSEFETVFSKEIREKMVTFKFMEDKAGQLKIHSTISKSPWCLFDRLIEGKVQTVEQARKLSFAGFDYRPDLSSDLELVFCETSIKPAHSSWFFTGLVDGCKKVVSLFCK